MPAVDLGLRGAVRRRHRACSASPARAARCTRSAATSTRRRAAGIRTDRVLWIVAGRRQHAGRARRAAARPAGCASVAAAQGNGAIFTVFAAAVIGGVSLNGGKGTMFGAFTGILLLFMIQNVLTLAGVPAAVDRRPQRRHHPRRAHRLPHHQRPAQE